MRIDYQTGVSNHILDLLTLIEREPAVNLIRNTPFAQSLLQDTALGIRTVKNGKIGIVIILPTAHLSDACGHRVGLFVIGIRREQSHLATLLPLRIDGLADLLRILVDQAIGRIDNILG